MNINQTPSSTQTQTITENQPLHQIGPDFTQFARQLNLAHQELDWFTVDNGRAEKKREALEQTQKQRRQKDQNDVLGNGAAIDAFQLRQQQQRAEIENTGLKAMLLDRKHQAQNRQQAIHQDIIHEKVTAPKIPPKTAAAPLKTTAADSEAGNRTRSDFDEALGLAKEDAAKPKSPTGIVPNDPTMERNEATGQRKAGSQALFEVTAVDSQMKNGGSATNGMPSVPADHKAAAVRNDPAATEIGSAKHENPGTVKPIITPGDTISTNGPGSLSGSGEKATVLKAAATNGIPTAPPDQKAAVGHNVPAATVTGSAKLETPGTIKPIITRGDAVSTSGSGALSGSGEKATMLKANAATAKSDKPTGNLGEIEQKVRYLLSSRKNELVMQLHPEHLGKLVIRLKKEGNRLTGHFRVDSIQAKEALEPQMAQLQRNLADQGIQVQNLRIHVNGDDPAASGQGFAFNDHGSTQHRESSSSASSHQSEPEEHRFQKSIEPAAPNQLSAESGINLYA
jgi:flagellar hook-length control protein FliK